MIKSIVDIRRRSVKGKIKAADERRTGKKRRGKSMIERTKGETFDGKWRWKAR